MGNGDQSNAATQQSSTQTPQTPPQTQPSQSTAPMNPPPQQNISPPPKQPQIPLPPQAAAVVKALVTTAAKPEDLSTRPQDATKTHVSTLAIGARGPRLHGIDPSLPEHQEKIDASLADYVVVQPMTPGSAFNFRVFCRECGWQTHCHVRERGVAMVRDHAVRHLYAV